MYITFFRPKAENLKSYIHDHVYNFREVIYEGGCFIWLHTYFFLVNVRDPISKPYQGRCGPRTTPYAQKNHWA